jgi:DNA mismatch endonuclease (patch repair protein)
MQGNRSRDTKPERLVRSELHRRGLRFLVDARPVRSIPRRADIVLRGSRLAVFVDGCFWHGCPIHYRAPRANDSYWTAKVETNRARDRDTDDRLGRAGWSAIRVWEHDDPVIATNRIVEAVAESRRRAIDTDAMSRSRGS